MSVLTLNGKRAISGSITFPYYGTSSADLLLASSTDIADDVAIVFGNLSVVASTVRKASFAGSRSLRAVGGRAGWRKTLPARGYSHDAGIKLSTIVGDAATEAGESVAGLTDRTLGSHYAREGGKPAERVLNLLLDGKWWVAPSGETRFDERDHSPIVTPFTVNAWSGSKGQFEISTEDLKSWQPGRTFTSPTLPGVQSISSVTIEADNDGKIRLHVLNADTAIERLRTDMRSLIRAESPTLNYAGVWEFTIAAGDSKTVDVISSDARMPSLTNVPMTPGLMGEVVTPTPGSKCRIVFVNQDPTRPECIGIIGTPIKIEIAGPLPTQASARFGDAVSGTAITLGSTKVFIGG